MENNQTPTECKHYYYGMCTIAQSKYKILDCMFSCIYRKDKQSCPDYEPKEKKDK